jgi:hypothetical protein
MYPGHRQRKGAVAGSGRRRLFYAGTEKVGGNGSVGRFPGGGDRELARAGHRQQECTASNQDEGSWAQPTGDRAVGLRRGGAMGTKLLRGNGHARTGRPDSCTCHRLQLRCWGHPVACEHRSNGGQDYQDEKLVCALHRNVLPRSWKWMVRHGRPDSLSGSVLLAGPGGEPLESCCHGWQDSCSRPPAHRNRLLPVVKQAANQIESSALKLSIAEAISSKKNRPRISICGGRRTLRLLHMNYTGVAQFFLLRRLGGD